MPLSKLAENFSLQEEVGPGHCARLGGQSYGWISFSTHPLCWVPFVLTQLSTNRCDGKVGTSVAFSSFILFFENQRTLCYNLPSNSAERPVAYKWNILESALTTRLTQKGLLDTGEEHGSSPVDFIEEYT